MAKRPNPEISGFTEFFFFEKGQEAQGLEPGDFIPTKRSGILGFLIRTGQMIRFKGKYAKWTHAALIVSKDGDIIEASGKGVARSHLSEYKKKEFPHLIRLGEMADEKTGRKW